jgi:hypothetical protein
VTVGAKGLEIRDIVVESIAVNVIHVQLAVPFSDEVAPSTLSSLGMLAVLVPAAGPARLP